MTSFLKAAIVALALATTGFAAMAQERPSTILVLDASGSMWGQIDGENKIVIARKVVADILADFPKDQNLGFVTYGHRERGQCSDIQTVIEPAPGTANKIIKIVNELNPRGMTPMTDAVIAAADALRHTEQAATVILVTDGIETCHPDPCAAARALEQTGVDFTAHVIGFDVKGETEALKQMQCIAEETGGHFLTADNAQELSQALQQVVTTEPALPEPVEITMIAVMGNQDGAQVQTPIIWTASTDNDEFELDGNPGVMKLRPGHWTVNGYHVALEREQSVQLVVAEGAAQTHVMVFDEPQPQPQHPTATVSAPAQAVVGSAFTVTWDAEDADPRDYVTIVPVGAKDGAYTDYRRIGDKTEGTLRAPAEPGLYEVRFQLAGNGRVLATTPIEVVDADVTVTAPAQTVVGSAFPVSWKAQGLHPQDYVTIVPAGAKAGTYTDYRRIGDKAEGPLRAPAEPGLYEVRLQLAGNGRVLATTPIEVIEGNVTISGPEKVRAGTTMALVWNGAVHPQDYITAVPTGTEDGKYADYIRVANASEGSLAAPAEPGLYEIRYHLQHGHRVMARQTVEVLAADAPLDDGAGLVVPQSGKPGEKIIVNWTGGTDSADQRVTLARAEQADFSWISAESAISRNSLEIVLPDDPGTYEVRFLDVANREVLGRSMIEVQP